MKRLIWAGFFIALIAVGVAVAYSNRTAIRDLLYERTKPDLPAAQTLVNQEESDIGQPPEPPTPPKPIEKTAPKTEPKTVPEELNLAVPFTSQAPHMNWDEDHEDFCEEASVLMARRYFAKEPAGKINPDTAEGELQEIKTWELEQFGYFKDTTAEETARIIREKYGLTAEVTSGLTLPLTKLYLSTGRLILVPAAGRELHNPFFKQPGPIYHMLVIHGFTNDGKLITNDPGTRRGEGYLYDPAVVFGAIADWDQATQTITKDRQPVIVVSK